MTDPRPVPLDLATVEDVVERVLATERRAVQAATAQRDEIAEAVRLVAGRIASGGRLLLAADDPIAATVLDLATADLVHDFGLREGLVVRLDDTTPTARDALVVVSTGEQQATVVDRRGAGTVLVSSAPTDADADVVIAPAVGDEPVHGVRRLGAATALKAVLDALTTAVVAQLGRVHDDLPVDLVATTDADRARVVAMVERIAEVGPDTARQAAEHAGHDVRVAVLALATGLDPAQASTLAANRRTLRDALEKLPRTPPAGRSVPG